MSTSINIVSGLGVPSQIPLNPKENIASEAALKDLGLNNNLAFTYEQGLIVYCRLEGTRYEWREVKSGEELTGLRDTDFTYPNGTVTDNVIYSNRKFNFFKIDNTSETDTSITQGDNIIITGNGTSLNPFIITGLSSPFNNDDDSFFIRDRNEINFGNIGNNSFDFSYALLGANSDPFGQVGQIGVHPSQNYGALGDYDFINGYNVSSEGNYNVIFGKYNHSTAQSNLSSVFGNNNYNNASNSFISGSFNRIFNSTLGYKNIFGQGNDVYGSSGLTSGVALINKSFSTTVLGQGNLDYTNTSDTINSLTSPIFIIGNGDITTPSGKWTASSRSDALKLLKNGLLTLPSVTNDLIAADITGKSVITKEYLESFSPIEPDGSETKVIAGTNITVTGNGTTITPYYISTNNDDISQYTDEMAQFAVGSILTNTDSVNFNYDDVLKTISANVNINSITSSSGILSGGALSINADPIYWNIAAGEGFIVDSLTGTVNKIEWDTQLGNTTVYLTNNISTYILVDINGDLIQQPTAPTQQQLRTHVYIGKLAHATLSTILFTVTEPVRMFDIVGQIADLNKAIGPINVGNGNVINHNGSNLTISVTAGGTYRPGSNYLTDRNSPSITAEPQMSAPSFRRKYRTGTGGWIAVNGTTIDPDRYDNNSGSLVTVPNGKYTVQVFWRFGGTGTIHVDYGQAYYDTLEQARASIGGAIVIQDPDNVRDAVKRGWLIVKQNTNVLNNTTDAVFIQADKFGERGATGAIPNLQVTYNNSSNPEIETNSVLGAFSLKRGSLLDTDNVFEIINGFGTVTSSIKGTGALTALTYNDYIPVTDLRNINTASPLLGGGNLTADRTLSIQESSTTQDGYLSSTNFNIFNNKQVTLVSGTNIKTVEGQSLLGSGNIDLTKSDVGLSNVDNTSDLNKPVSTLTQISIDGKVSDTIRDGITTIAPSENAVFEALALKANDSDVIHTTGDETKTGSLTINNLILPSQPLGTPIYKISGTVAISDSFSIFGEASEEEKGKLVFEVGDNAMPYDSGGQKFEFRYNANSSGVSKTPLTIDYNEITALANITATSFIKSGGSSSQFLKADGSIDGTTYEPAFSKNTAFNKNFGNSSGTVTEGNDSRLSDSRTPTAGSSSYIQNQNILAQTADMWISGNGRFQGTMYSKSGFSSYVADGLFSGSALPSVVETTSGQSIRFGYFDYGGGQYNARIGFTGNTNWSIGSTGSDVNDFSIGIGGNDNKLTFAPSGAAAFASTVSATSFNGGAALTGTPTAPTATAGTNTTQIATMEAVSNALSGSVNYILKKTGTGVLENSNISDNGSTITLSADTNVLGSVTFQDIVQANDLILLNNYTVATLPTGAVTGAIAYVTDLTSPTYRGVATGGGSLKGLVFYDGTNWLT